MAANNQAHAEAGASVNQIRIDSARILPILLAVSVMVNIGVGWLVYTEKTEKRLQEYDLDWFKSQDFAQLKGEVSAHDKLITMLQIRKECLK
jgi:hypothetical protein